jgi:hypothetical protein
VNTGQTSPANAVALENSGDRSLRSHAAEFTAAMLTARDETPPSEEDTVDFRWFGCDSHQSRPFHRGLHGLQRLHAMRLGRSGAVPTAVEVNVTSEPASESGAAEAMALVRKTCGKPGK